MPELRKRPSYRFAITLAVASLLYVIAGFFWDLPPQGIHLDSSESHVKLGRGTAEVRVRLKYVCTSWRPRRTDVYFPFCHAHGEEEVSHVDCNWQDLSYRTYADGVILFLAMEPHSSRTVEFSFRQRFTQKRFDCIFGQNRGWELPANLIDYTVEAPRDMRCAFSVQPSRIVEEDTEDVEKDEMKVAAIKHYMLPGDDGKGLTVTWE